MRCVDARRVALVRQGMSDRADIAGLNRMDDLQDKGQDHTWMWALSKHRGPVMDDEDHIEAVRLRLGIVGPIDVVPCGLCGDTVMDNSGAHALCCARAESTKGHHCVTRQLADEIRCADPTLEVEPMGLVPGTELRPADILTGALGNGLTALDIGIASPDACNAGEDCTQTMSSRKFAKYREHQHTLDRQNIAYQPLTFSCYGRLHPDTTAILRTFAQRIARRRGWSAGEWRFRRLRSKLVTQIWARAGRTVRSCWPDRAYDSAGDEGNDTELEAAMAALVAAPPPGL